MSSLLQQVEAESVHALQAFYETRPASDSNGYFFSSVEICFSHGQRLWISCLSLPKRPPQILFNGRHLAEFIELEKVWKDDLKLVGFEFTKSEYRTGLFSNEERNHVFGYDVVSKKLTEETFR